MDSRVYIDGATTTESTNFTAMGERVSKDETLRLLHSGIGLSTEAGEILDNLKKHIFYGKDIDRVNLAEEMGDIFWYLAIMADALDLPFEQIMDTNLKKLKARYGDKFDAKAANQRNLNTERDILEQGL